MTVRTLLSKFDGSSYEAVKVSEVVNDAWVTLAHTDGASVDTIPTEVLDREVTTFGVGDNYTLTIRVGE